MSNTSVTAEAKANFIAGLSDYDALWLTIYGESRGEPIECQIGVGNVIVNRARAKGCTIKEACVAPFQFSCWNNDDPNLQAMMTAFMGPSKFEKNVLEQIKHVTAGLVSKFIMDNTNGSNHYLTTKLYLSPNCPNWARPQYSAKSKVVLGRHTFLWCP